jgi:hypothetical protein
VAAAAVPSRPSRRPPEDLYDDPTHFEGPEAIEASLGAVKGVYFKLNAKDGFLGAGRRGELRVTCDHPDIGPDEITVGELRSGRVRVSLAIPESADLGMYEINVVIPPWSKSSGGLGPQFEWTTKIELVEESRPRPRGGRGTGGSGKSGPGEGGLVALIWKSEGEPGVEDWTAATVGNIEMVTGSELAAQKPEYSELAGIDDELPTIVLNRTYSPLKAYVQARAAELTDEGKEQARERYAVGVGVGAAPHRPGQQEGREGGKGSGRRCARRGSPCSCPCSAECHARVRPARSGGRDRGLT